MSNIVQKDELQRAKVALFINAMATLVTFLTWINIINTGATLPIICATIGFAGFIFFTIIVYLRFSKLQKTYRQAL
jgi:hypothetical protein